MAASMASGKPPLAAPAAEDDHDPFVSPPTQPPLRFSGFDHKLFALGPASSPGQAKRALEAHLAETERRMAEAGKLGTALVQQQRELKERLAEVEKLQAEGELNDDLRQKLVEIEKDYNDVARETARAFLPKQRVPSNEAPGSPYVPEGGKGGRRSVSPSKFESQATGSPTKLSVPNRKLRNQPANRIHDIEFAAEISTSLIAQVRNLQALLAEKDEELRDTKADKSRLEIDAEGLQQRLKSLDESEHRYKDENWNLETQIQELLAAQKEASDKEKRLTQSLNVLQAEKNKAQRELDEVKLSHSKLAEEHATAIKHHDIELGAAKRSAATAENERMTMQRKIEDLTSQNQELAKAYGSQRGRQLEREIASGLSDEEFETATDNATPEHSPPPSPVKGTPRHSVLESETLKTSLHHAQRTIMSQRTQLHREKTEKLELKRILQDARDELERLRSEAGLPSNRRAKKVDSRDMKKSSKLLGAFRSSREEIYLDEEEWEDHDGEASPRGVSAPRKSIEESSDQFETANETSDAAFETANERGTETEDFHTGAEEFSDEDDDVQTETESPSKGVGRMKRPPLVPVALGKSASRMSFDSTASTSNDEDYDFAEIKTPTAAPPPQRMRLRVNRGLLSRRSRQTSEEPFQGSPASFANSSSTTTPQPPAGQSLFAELADLEGSDDESYGGTPSKAPMGSAPGSISRGSALRYVPSMPRLAMVDSGMMTEPDNTEPGSVEQPAKSAMVDSEAQTDEHERERVFSPASIIHHDRPMSMESAVLAEDPEVSFDKRASTHWLLSRDESTDTDRSRPVSTLSYSDAGAQHDPDMEEKLSMFPLPPTTTPSRRSSIPTLGLSAVATEAVEPVVEPPAAPPSLAMSAMQSEDLEPKAEPVVEVPAPVLSMTAMESQSLEPKAEPVVQAPLPTLSMASLDSQSVEPVAEPAVEIYDPKLTVGAVQSEAVEPIAELVVETPRPTLGMTAVESQSWEPKEEALPAPPSPPALGLSGIQSEHVEPVQEPEPIPELAAAPAVVEPPRPTLGLSAVESRSVEPLAELEEPTPARPVLGFTAVESWEVEPKEDPVPRRPSLSMTSIVSEDVAPVQPPSPKIATPALGFSGVLSEQVTPVQPPLPKPVTPALNLSGIVSENITPVQPPSPKLVTPALNLSGIVSENITPVQPPSPKAATSAFGYTNIASIETRPETPRSPKRDGFIIPRDDSDRAHSASLFGSVLGRGKNRSATPPIIAEDETRQSPRDTPQPETPESQRPLKDMSTNTNFRPIRKPKMTTTESSAQTSLTAEALEQMMKARQRPSDFSHERQLSLGSSQGTPGTVRIRRGSCDSMGSASSPVRSRGRMADAAVETPYRPSSASSSRAPMQPLPPLPPNHKQAIEAARSNSSSGGQGTIGSMGPPLWPASALKNRPQTPSGSKPGSSHSMPGTPTPRPIRAGSALGNTGTHSPTRLTHHSRQSSVSSFASELDTRFNMHSPVGVNQGVDSTGLGPNTDPRMIQAITQTMIGEFLWKYTRKTGRSEPSMTRHRRYFWVHPYTRTLYWSNKDPSRASRSELKTKSVPIEAVRVVTDDNPYPPGLHRKSLVVISPGRTVKFTCTTGQRHETWFNALSYLLLRTNNEGQTDAEEMAGHITSEDVAEFNPQVGRRRPNGTRARPPPSLSSYNSRGTRTESPAMDMSMNIPTLNAASKIHAEYQPQRPTMGTLSRISGYWKSSQVISGTLGSLRSRNSSRTREARLYETNEVHDSAEDLRQMIERQDREADRLENVRACCDGKHDVGTLTQGSKRGRHSYAHTHTTPGASGTATPVSSTVRSRR